MALQWETSLFTAEGKKWGNWEIRRLKAGERKIDKRQTPGDTLNKGEREGEE